MASGFQTFKYIYIQSTFKDLISSSVSCIIVRLKTIRLFYEFMLSERNVVVIVVVVVVVFVVIKQAQIITKMHLHFLLKNKSRISPQMLFSIFDTIGYIPIKLTQVTLQMHCKTLREKKDSARSYSEVNHTLHTFLKRWLPKVKGKLFQQYKLIS